MLGGPERRVPGRPARGVGRGVQERVRGVRDGAVLLQRRVRQRRHVPAVGLLGVLQERVPARLQLRLRRRHLHLHLLRRRRRLRLRHHLLPQHNQREVGRVEPAGAGGAAADQRHDGVPRRRPARRRRCSRAAAVTGPPRRRSCRGAPVAHAAAVIAQRCRAMRQSCMRCK